MMDDCSRMRGICTGDLFSVLGQKRRLIRCGPGLVGSLALGILTGRLAKLAAAQNQSRPCQCASAS